MKPDSFCKVHGIVRPECHAVVSPLAESSVVARQTVEEQGIGE